MTDELLSDAEVLKQSSVHPEVGEYNSDRLRNIEDINSTLESYRKAPGPGNIRLRTLQDELKKEQDLLGQSDEQKYFLKQQEYQYSRAAQATKTPSPIMGPANQTPLQAARTTAPAAQDDPNRLLTDEEVGASPRWGFKEQVQQAGKDLASRFQTPDRFNEFADFGSQAEASFKRPWAGGRRKPTEPEQGFGRYLEGAGEAAERRAGGAEPARVLQHPEMEPRERIGIGMDFSKPSFERRPEAGLIGHGKPSDVGSLLTAFDMFAGAPAQIYKSGYFFPHMRDYYMFQGYPPHEASKMAQDFVNKKIPEALVTPAKRIAVELGMDPKEYDESYMARAFGVMGQAVKEGSEAAGESSGIPPQDIEEAVNFAMNALGVAGVAGGVIKGRMAPTRQWPPGVRDMGEGQRRGEPGPRGPKENLEPEPPSGPREWPPNTRDMGEGRPVEPSKQGPLTGVEEPPTPPPQEQTRTWPPNVRDMGEGRRAEPTRQGPAPGDPNPEIRRLPPEIPRTTLKEPQLEAAQKFLDQNGGGPIDPQVLKTMGAAGALIAAGGWLYMNPEEAKKLGAAIGSGLVLGGAIRTAGGGFVHPNAKYFLSSQFNYQYRSPLIVRASDLQRELDTMTYRRARIQRRMREDQELGEPGNPADAEMIKQIDAEMATKEPELSSIRAHLDTVDAWMNKAAENYLRRHASTPNDPIKDVKVPPPQWSDVMEPMTWEQAFDQVLTGKPVREYHDPAASEHGPPGSMNELYGARRMPNQEEPVWDTIGGFDRYEPRARQEARRAIEEFMDRVGEYAREHIPPDDLVKKDFPTLIQQYAKHQRQLELARLKPAAEDKRVSPVYRQYEEFTSPTGAKDQYYWQELDRIGQLYREGEEMKHSVGGYEPYAAKYDETTGELLYPAHPDYKEGMPQSYHVGPHYGRGGRDAWKSGFVKIYSLRNKAGNSLVTIETVPQWGAEAKFYREAPQEFRDKYPAPRQDPQTVAQQDALENWVRAIRYSPEFIEAKVPHGVAQIKGFNNKKVKELTEPYVLDFLRSKNWEYVSDIDLEEYTPFVKFEGKIATEKEIKAFTDRALDVLMEHPSTKTVATMVERMEKDPTFALPDHVDNLFDQTVVRSRSDMPFSLGEVLDALDNPLANPSATLQILRAIEHTTGWQERFDPKSPLDPNYSALNKQLGKVAPELIGWLAVGGTAAAIAAYVANDKKLRASVMAALGVAGFAMLKPAQKGLDYVIKPIATRLYDMAPVMTRKVRDLDHFVMKQGDVALDEVHPFLQALSKEKGSRRQEIEAALLENDPRKIQAAFRGNQALIDGWNDVQATTQRLGARYVPMSLKENMGVMDKKTLQHKSGLDGLKEVMTPAAQQQLETVLAIAEAKKIKDSLHGLSSIEQSMFVDRFLRASQSDIFEPAFRGGHRGPATELMDKLTPFFHSATDNLLRHVGMGVYEKELARFFGGSRKTMKVGGQTVTNVDKSILNLVNNGVARGRIPKEHAAEVIDILKSRFGPGEKSMSGLLQDVRNWTNTGLLGSFHAAATQIGDSIMTVYHHGMLPVLEAVARQAGGKQYVTTKEFGLLNHIAEELGSQRFSGRFLHGAFGKTGFKAIDMFAKNVNLNASLIKNSKLARTQKGRDFLFEKYGDAYGTEFNQLVSDLAARRRTDLVDSVLFSELADAQPISKSEMSQAMLDHPNGRLLGQMKTYMQKQVDIIRRDAFGQISKGHYLRGMKNLLAVSVALSLSNVPGEAVKDWLSGRPLNLNVDHVENLLQNFGLNRYTLDKMNKRKSGSEAVQEFATQMATPPVFSVLRDLSSPDTAVKLIPGPGRAVYDRWLGGNERRAAAIERSKKEQEKRNKPGEQLSPIEQERRENRKRQRRRYASLDEAEDQPGTGN
ncbi:MAG TPA: hypothetical protein VF077_09100 [Nitrospiraceae bacterium]